MSFSFGSSPPPVLPAPTTSFRFGTQNPVGFTFGPPTEAPKEAATPTSIKTEATKPSKPTATPSTPAAKPPASLADGVEGVVEFPSRGLTSYRFEIVAKDGKLHIWLEDRKTKKQWRTAQLALEDFVTEGLVIPQATFDDYAKCFLNCLESPTANTDFARDLVAAADVADAWELQLTLQIRVFTTAWKPMYSFLLKPVPLGPVDLLTAKIRDQEELIADLQRQVESLTAQRERDGHPAARPPLFARGTLDRNAVCGKLVWKSDERAPSDKILFNSSGSIRFNVGGTFVVNASVQHTNSNNNTTVELLVNGESIVTCVDSSSDRRIHTSPICHVLTVAQQDELSVMYRGNNNACAGSFIVIHELR